MTFYNKISVLSTLLLSSLCISVNAGHDQLGMQTHYGHKGWEPLSTIKPIKEMGVGWIRDDIFWSAVEKEKGKYKIPDSAWEWIKEARKNDLKIILILNGGNKLYKDPYDHDGYVNFTKFVAKEMKGHVQALELINEPFGHFRKDAGKLQKGHNQWNGWDAKTKTVDFWVKKYLKTMNAMADAIHEVAPGEYKVIGLGCAPPLNKHMLKMGVSKHLDGIVLHPYSYTLPPERIPYGDTPNYNERDGIAVGDKDGNLIAINADLVKTAGPDGPQEIWLTEQGYTTFQPFHSGSHYEGFTESAQAKYAQRRLMECLGTNVRLASWYNFYSKGDRKHDSEDNFGIMRRDGSLKPVYQAIKTVATTMIDWKPDNWGTVDVYLVPDRPKIYKTKYDKKAATPAEVRIYKFVNKKNSSHAVAIWSTERAGGDLQPRTADITIKPNFKFSKITLMDMMTGKVSEIKYTKEGEDIVLNKITIPDYPAFLEFK